ncbi:MAG TPA: DUF4864 domain-containing protein [Rubricoccaceae bacterium]|jgi:hypothetical protein
MTLPLPAAAAAVLCAMAAAAPVSPRTTGAPEPSPDLSPAEVVRIQVDALRRNDDPTPGAGIATAFRFASPSNRRVTGPLPRFDRMIREGYADLLGFARAEYGEPRIAGDRAVVPVTLVQRDGRRVTFGFALSRQTDGRCTGCWLTDAVVERPEPTGGLRRI